MNLTLEQRTNRMQNLKSAAVANTKYGRRMYIHDYLPGHAGYDAELTCDTAAFERLKALAETGVDVLWVNAQFCVMAAVKKFTDLCHYFGLRVVFPVTNWENAPGAQWRHDVMPQVLRTMEEGGFDGIFADMSQLEFDNSAAHDPELEDMLWQLYTQVKNRGGVLILRTQNGCEPPCIDTVYDYLLSDGKQKDLNTAGFVLPGCAKTFAETIPFLQLPMFCENTEQWMQYRKLYAPMVEENTLAFLDLKESTEFVGVLPEDVHVSMFINHVNYLAVSNLSDKPVTLELNAQWTDRITDTIATTFTMQPAQLLLLKR